MANRHPVVFRRLPEPVSATRLGSVGGCEGRHEFADYPVPSNRASICLSVRPDLSLEGFRESRSGGWPMASRNRFRGFSALVSVLALDESSAPSHAGVEPGSLVARLWTASSVSDNSLPRDLRNRSSQVCAWVPDCPGQPRRILEWNQGCCARGAESVDATDLKSVVREDVWVRVPPRAPLILCRVTTKNFLGGSIWLTTRILETSFPVSAIL